MKKAEKRRRRCVQATEDGAGHSSGVSRQHARSGRRGGDHRQWDKVLQLVKSVRDQIKALVLDNTNIRAACDDLRRQCHSQGSHLAICHVW